MKKIKINFVESADESGSVLLKAKQFNRASRQHLKTAAFFAVIILLSFLVCFSVVKAGSLTPPGVPSATMKTLQDIYLRITAGTAAGTHTLAPAGAPAATMYTLDDVYSKIPTNDKVLYGTNGGTANTPPGSGTTAAGVGDVVSGKYCFTANGSSVSGSITAGSDVTVTSASTTIPAGYYSGSQKCSSTAGTTVTATSSSGNAIPAGYYNGTPKCMVGLTPPTDGSTAATVTGDVMSNKYCFKADGTEITGSATAGYTYGDNSAANVLTIAASHGAGGTSYDATNLTANTVKDGVLFGVGSEGNIGLPKTGQITSYPNNNPTDIDDGHYQSGAPHPSLQGRFTNNTDGTITDNATGLQWVKQPELIIPGASVISSNQIQVAMGDWTTGQNYAIGDLVSSTGGDAGPYYVCIVAHYSGTFATDLAAGKWIKTIWTATAANLLTPQNMVWDSTQGDPDALSACKNLNYAGTGWRLPNIKELQSIVDYGKSGPAIDPLFTDARSDLYWSSTTYAGYQAFAWHVDFGNGLVNYDGKDSSYFVRCVR